MNRDNYWINGIFCEGLYEQDRERTQKKRIKEKKTELTNEEKAYLLNNQIDDNEEVII